jgi:hypothetical protein
VDETPAVVATRGARAEAHFFDNYFDILPGEAITVEWSGAVGGAVRLASIRDTY